MGKKMVIYLISRKHVMKKKSQDILGVMNILVSCHVLNFENESCPVKVSSDYSPISLISRKVAFFYLFIFYNIEKNIS